MVQFGFPVGCEVWLVVGWLVVKQFEGMRARLAAVVSRPQAATTSYGFISAPNKLTREKMTRNGLEQWQEKSWSVAAQQP